MAQRYEGAVPTEFEVESYLVCPPSKLYCRWGGPFEVLSRNRNNVIVGDLTNDARQEYDVSRLRVFLVATSVGPKVVATSG